MNTFENALNEIKKEYPLRRMSETYAQIEFNEDEYLFDAYNYIFIGVLYEDDKVILTDNADYAPLCNFEEKDLLNVSKICQKHSLNFINWHIECLYRSNEDIKNYLACLFELREEYL